MNAPVGFFVDALGNPTGAGISVDPASGAPTMLTSRADGSRVATPMGGLSISLGDSFDTVVAKMRKDTNFIFGSAAQSPGAVSIPDLPTLATYFNPFEDGTGKGTINAEIQRYKEFNSTNHVFQVDKLELTAAGTIAAPYPVYTTDATGPSLVPGTVNPIARFGRADTTGVFVGQVIAIRGKGIYYITAVVVDTSITFSQFAGGASTGAAPAAICMFTGWVYAFLATATTRTNDLTFTLAMTAALGVAGTPGIPTGLAVGMQPGANSGTSVPFSRVGDVRITSINQGTGVVTVAGDPSWTQGDYAAGTGIIFGPAFTSGQIWSKNSWDFFGGGYQAIAFEIDCDLPPTDTSGTVTDTSTVTTAALYSALPVNVPMGAWPAFWIYAAQNLGVGVVPNLNATEMDIFELYTSTTTSFKQWTGGNVLKYPSQGTNFYVGTFTGDSQVNAGQTSGATVNSVPSSVILTLATPLSGRHKFQFIWTPTRTFRYIDGVLRKADTFTYYSMNNGQYGVNMAMGSLLAGLGGNLQFPARQEHLSNMKIGVRQLKSWTA